MKTRVEVNAVDVIDVDNPWNTPLVEVVPLVDGVPSQSILYSIPQSLFPNGQMPTVGDRFDIEIQWAKGNRN